MTLSSSASRGVVPKGEGSESAMPKGESHRMSDSSSEGGAGQMMSGLQRTLKRFAEPSEDSRQLVRGCIDDEQGKARLTRTAS